MIQIVTSNRRWSGKQELQRAVSNRWTWLSTVGIAWPPPLPMQYPAHPNKFNQLHQSTISDRQYIQTKILAMCSNNCSSNWAYHCRQRVHYPADRLFSIGGNRQCGHGNGGGDSYGMECTPPTYTNHNNSSNLTRWKINCRWEEWRRLGQRYMHLSRCTVHHQPLQRRQQHKELWGLYFLS